MSFSKARIQRFNELPSEAPPPGAYDPKFDVKVEGSVIEEKTGRFNDAKSTSSCECNASVSSQSTSNTSAKNQISDTKDQASDEPLQELADLKIECANKDETIHEYEKHIEDMKAEIKDLNEKYHQTSILKLELKELQTKISELEEKKYDFEELKLLRKYELESLRSNLENEIILIEILENEIKQSEKTIKDVTDECNEIKGRCFDLVDYKNNKERLKHVFQLKEMIDVQELDLVRLRQELDMKNNEINELRKANEKLKVQERRQFGLG